MAFTVTAYPDQVDSYGDPVTGTPRTIEGCTDWPRTTTDRAGAMVQSIEGRTLSLPRGEAPIPGDWTVTYPDGTRWRVVGEPYPYSQLGGPTLNLERRS